MADISTITLDNGDTYDIKDAVARANSGNKCGALYGAYLSESDISVTPVVAYTATEHCEIKCTYFYFLNSNTGSSRVQSASIVFDIYNASNSLVDSISVSAGSLEPYSSVSLYEDDEHIPLITLEAGGYVKISKYASSYSAYLKCRLRFYVIPSSTKIIASGLKYSSSSPKSGLSRFSEITYRSILYTASEDCEFRITDATISLSVSTAYGASSVLYVGLFTSNNVCVLDIPVASAVKQASSSIGSTTYDYNIPDYDIPMMSGWKIAIGYGKSGYASATHSATVKGYAYKK